MATASSSVFTEASAIQKTGKKTMKATPQPRTVINALSRGLTCMTAPSVEIACDGAHEEESHDVGQNDGDDTAC